MQSAPEVALIKGKIVGGVVALTTRTFVLQLISFSATFILTILLTPSVFGVYFLVTAVISFLTYFSDVGLAAALIQKKSEPTREELVTSFTLQQLLVGTVVLLLIIFTPQIALFYKLNSGGVFLLKALAVSFFLSSLKTIPSVVLERRLAFGKLVLPQILETLSFYLVAIILAASGGKEESFGWAALVRGIVGLGSIYLVAPWRPGLGINFTSTKTLLTFGVPFQLNSILALVKDDLMTMFLARILPISQIGYIGWAKKWAEAPLRLIMDSIVRVTFPAYARLQENRDLLAKALSKSFFFLGLCIFPVTIIMVVLIRPLLSIVPRYGKWEPAVLSFYLFAASSAVAAFSSTSVNVLNAVGKIRTTLALMVMWTIATWIFVPYLALQMGFNGVATAAVVISVTSIFPVYFAKRITQANLLAAMKKPTVATLMMAIPFIVFFIVPITIASIAISTFASVVIYLAIVLFWMHTELRPYLPEVVLKKLRILSIQ